MKPGLSRRTIPLVLMAGLLLGLTWILRENQGPRFEGRTTASWFGQYSAHFARSEQGNGQEVQFAQAERAQAERALRSLGTNAVPFLLLTELPRKKPPLWRAIEALGDRSPKILKQKHQAWQHSWELRQLAARQLLEVLQPPGSLLLDLEQRAPRTISRVSPLTWLAQFCGEEKELLLPHLRGALRSADPLEQSRALSVLQQFGPDTPSILPDLIEMELVNPTNFYRWLRALQVHGEEAQMAAPKLWELFENEQFPPRKAQLAETLGLIDPNPEQAVAFLSEQLYAPEVLGSTSHLQAMLQHLESIGPKAREAIPALLDLLDREKQAHWRQWILKTIHALDPEKEPLLAFLKDDRRARTTANNRLALAGEMLIVDPGNPEAIQMLIELLQFERSANIRATALHYLQRQGSAAQPALPMLEILANDPQLQGEAKRVKQHILQSANPASHR
jgi:hypothetical protein